MVLDQFIIKIEIPNWMSEAEQDAQLERLENTAVINTIRNATLTALSKKKGLTITNVTVER